MPKPVVPQKQPHVVMLRPGNYYWCACGLSRRQPYCDGSHKGGGFSPVRHTQVEEGQVALCGCKQTSTPPFCDDSHEECREEK